MATDNGGNVSIRPARLEDVDAIVRIAIAAWEPIYQHRRRLMGETLYNAFHPDWRNQKESEVRSAFNGPESTAVCVAEEDGQVVGFAVYHTDPVSAIGEIGNNAVRPDSQGKGIGTIMYRHVFEVFRNAGMRYVEVATGGDEAHAPARSAYKKAGFEIELPSVRYYRSL